MEKIMGLLGNHSFLVVALGASLLGMVTGALGCYALLRKQSLLGDGIAHCALPGVVMAFLLTGEKDLFTLLTGGGIWGILGCLTLVCLCKYSPIKFDSALSMTLSVFFGFGLVLLSHAQKIPNANQAGLDRFIYGQAAAMLRSDVEQILCCGLFIAVVVCLGWKPFQLFTFDPTFAQTLGYATGKINLLLHSLLIMAIVMGLQTVGAILMSAMLVAPGITARPWVKSLRGMMGLSMVIGGGCAFLGTLISSLYGGMPTGAVIVVVSTGVAVASLGLHSALTHISLPIRHNKREKEETPCHLPQKSN